MKNDMRGEVTHLLLLLCSVLGSYFRTLAVILVSDFCVYIATQTSYGNIQTLLELYFQVSRAFAALYSQNASVCV